MCSISIINISSADTISLCEGPNIYEMKDNPNYGIQNILAVELEHEYEQLGKT